MVKRNKKSGVELTRAIIISLALWRRGWLSGTSSLCLCGGGLSGRDATDAVVGIINTLIGIQIAASDT